MEMTTEEMLAHERMESEAESGAEEAAGEDGTAQADSAEEETPRFAEMAEKDLAELKRLFPETEGICALWEMPNAVRFGELRELGLSVREAYMACSPLRERENNRGHLRSSVPRRVGGAGMRMSGSEFDAARKLFPNMSEREIHALYRRVAD